MDKKKVISENSSDHRVHEKTNNDKEIKMRQEILPYGNEEKLKKDK